MIKTTVELQDLIDTQITEMTQDGSDYLNGWAHCVYESASGQIVEAVRKFMAEIEPRPGYWSDLNLTAEDIEDRLYQCGEYDMVAYHWGINRGFFLWSQPLNEVEVTIAKAELCPEFAAFIADPSNRSKHGFYITNHCQDYISFAEASDLVVHAEVARHVLRQIIAEAAADAVDLAPCLYELDVDGVDYIIEVHTAGWYPHTPSISLTNKETDKWAEYTLPLAAFESDTGYHYGREDDLFPWTVEDWDAFIGRRGESTIRDASI